MIEQQVKQLDKATVDGIFETATEPADYIGRLYRTLYGDDWDRIEKLEGYVKIAPTGGHYICEKAIEFDRAFYPPVGPGGEREALPGGAWLNYGFSTDADLGERAGGWQVRLAPAKIKEA